MDVDVPGPRSAVASVAPTVTQFAGGYDFATVLKAYWRGSEDSNDTLKEAAVRWLRAEYSTKTDARKDLGVRNIIDDDNVYESLKSLACLVRIVGYSGLFVMFDEMANIYKLQNSQARKQNYEQLLDIVNDSLQRTTSSASSCAEHRSFCWIVSL